SRVTRIRSTTWPNEPPTVAVRMLACSQKTSRVQTLEFVSLQRSGPSTAITASVHTTQSISSAAKRRVQLATLPGPDAGKPSRAPGYGDGAGGGADTDPR